MHYLDELTARDFFVLRPPLDPNAHGIDRPIQLIFSEPVWDSEMNLKRIELFDGSTSVPVGSRRMAGTLTSLLYKACSQSTAIPSSGQWSCQLVSEVIIEATEYQDTNGGPPRPRTVGRI